MMHCKAAARDVRRAMRVAKKRAGRGSHASPTLAVFHSHVLSTHTRKASTRATAYITHSCVTYMEIQGRLMYAGTDPGGTGGHLRIAQTNELLRLFFGVQSPLAPARPPPRPAASTTRHPEFAFPTHPNC
jgi:hypothetical protein